MNAESESSESLGKEVGGSTIIHPAIKRRPLGRGRGEEPLRKRDPSVLEEALCSLTGTDEESGEEEKQKKKSHKKPSGVGQGREA